MLSALRRERFLRWSLMAVVAVAAIGGAYGISSASASGSHTRHATAATGQIVAVGAENEYANVIAQIGGKYVKVSAIMSNPNTDPHTFEASASVAETVSAAKLIVQNGVGYDDFMSKIESASSSSSRKVIDVQKVLGLPDSTPNPHLWYSPKTMPAVAKALVGRPVGACSPSHAAYFKTNAKRFDDSLKPWLSAIEGVQGEVPRYAGRHD